MPLLCIKGGGRWAPENKFDLKIRHQKRTTHKLPFLQVQKFGQKSSSKSRRTKTTNHRNQSNFG